MYPGEKFYSDSETSEAVVTASVRLRDVGWLKRALVAGVAAIGLSSRWEVHSESARATIEDYANEILDSLQFYSDAPAPDYVELAAITTAALQTVTIASLRVSTGAFTVNFGDNYEASYPAGYTGSVARTYTNPGVYRIRINAPRYAITHLTLTDSKLIIAPGTITPLSGLAAFHLDNLPYGFITSGEFGSKLNLSYLYIRNAPGVAYLTALQSLPALQTARITNAYTAAQVVGTLNQFYGQSYIKTSEGGSLNLAGNNAAPGGTFVSACPPTNGLQYRYQLLYGTCGTFINASKRWQTVEVTP